MTPTKSIEWENVIATAKNVGKPLMLYGASWNDYQDLQRTLGNNFTGVRVSFNRGILEIIPISTEHEHYIKLIEQFITVIKLRTRQRVSFFGSATLEKDEKCKGAQPDASFFVQRADLISGKIRFNIADTPPDVVV